jgi:hypothetical protein
MNNIAKNTPTEKCPWKRSLSVTSEQKEIRNRHVNCWPIIIADHLLYKNNVSLFSNGIDKRKICSNYVHNFSVVKLCDC